MRPGCQILGEETCIDKEANWLNIFDMYPGAHLPYEQATSFFRKMGNLGKEE